MDRYTAESIDMGGWGVWDNRKNELVPGCYWVGVGVSEVPRLLAVQKCEELNKAISHPEKRIH